jgi:hypothetical protein
VNKKKKHIDDVFKDGLKNLRQMVSDKDFDAIDKKSSTFKDGTAVNSKNLFSDFELPVTEDDWLNTKSKLDNEKLNIQKDVPELTQLSDLEIQPDPNDWLITYQKYKAEKRKKIFFFWFNRAGILLGLLFIGLLVWLSIKEPTSELSVALSNSNHKINTPPLTALSDKTNSTLNNNSTTHSETKTQNNSEISNSANETQTTTSLQKHNLKNTPNQFSFLKKPLHLDEALQNPEIEDNQTGPNVENNSSTNETALENNTSHETDITALTLMELTQNLNNNYLNMLLYGMQKYPDNFSLLDLNQNQSFKPIKKPGTFSLNFAMVNKVDYTYRKLSRDNPSKYNSIKNSADKAQYRYSGGFEVTLPTKKMLYTAGLNYSTYSFQSNYNYNYRVFDSIPVYDQTGTVVIGHFLTRGRDTSINEYQNIKISQIQMPLSLSYRLYKQKRLSIYAGFGSVLSMNTKQSGLKMINPINNQLYYYQRLENMERKFNVAPLLMGDIQYSFGNNWSISAGFSGSMNLKSRFKTSFGAKEYLYSYGLQFKIIKQLTWYK